MYCLDAGTTSQPSMGAIVNALHGTSLATGIDPLWLARLSIYWEQVWPSCAHSLSQLQMCCLYPGFTAAAIAIQTSPWQRSERLASSLDFLTSSDGAELNQVAAAAQTRGLYAPFESDLRSSSSDVYYHEMPGGQYTNLKFQVAALPLLVTLIRRHVARERMCNLDAEMPAALQEYLFVMCQI